MKYSIRTAAAAAAFIAAVSAVPQAGTTEPLLFTGLSQGPSGTSLNAGIINANNGSFWIGKPTTTAGDGGDPLSAVNSANTANKNTTIFSYLNAQGNITLSTSIPGGQKLYVAISDGKLGFTVGGSFGELPARTVDNGFNVVYDGILQFEGKGWFACQVGEEEEEVYEVYAENRSSGEGCLGFTFELQQVQPPYKGGPSRAWQYV